MAGTRPDDLEALASASGVPKAALRATVHLRRYMPLYAFGTIWALMVVLLPTVHHSSTPSNGTTVSGSAQGAEQGAVSGDQTAAGPTGQAAAPTAGGSAGNATPGAAPSAAPQP